jgi:hypothetical protein
MYYLGKESQENIASSSTTSSLPIPSSASEEVSQGIIKNIFKLNFCNTFIDTAQSPVFLVNSPIEALLGFFTYL